jgi:hypothetical protein
MTRHARNTEPNPVAHAKVGANDEREKASPFWTVLAALVISAAGVVVTVLLFHFSSQKGDIDHIRDRLEKLLETQSELRGEVHGLRELLARDENLLSSLDIANAELRSRLQGVEAARSAPATSPSTQSETNIARRGPAQ